MDSTQSQAAEKIHESVQNYYGKVLQKTQDLKTGACCSTAVPNKVIQEALSLVPDEIQSRYYGCGITIPMGIENLHVLDLGSGSGQDCYIAAKLVGPNGSVTGVDMTDGQLQIARQYVDEFCLQTLKYPKSNLHFVKGYIEELEQAGVKQESMDIVISNCVINLSPNKRQVLAGVYSVLKTGGELYFSDVYADRRLPDAVRNDEILFGECLGGALYKQDFENYCREVGFSDPRIVSVRPFEVGDVELERILGGAKFFSITYRCFKLPNLEATQEDYGHQVLYKGTIPGSVGSYAFDATITFQTHKPTPVSSNVAEILRNSWLSKYFDVIGDGKLHFGKFDSSACCAPNSKGCCPPKSSSSSASGCCATSSGTDKSDCC